MSERSQLVVFTYDISEDRQRSKVSKVLENFGTRVQFSVFECRLTASKAKALLARLDLLRDSGDSIRMYVVPEHGRLLSQSAGGAPISEKTDFWLF